MNHSMTTILRKTMEPMIIHSLHQNMCRRDNLTALSMIENTMKAISNLKGTKIIISNLTLSIRSTSKSLSKKLSSMMTIIRNFKTIET
jgi:hypothetical protein